MKSKGKLKIQLDWCCHVCILETIPGGLVLHRSVMSKGLKYEKYKVSVWDEGYFTDCCPIYKFVKLSIIYLCNFNEFGSSTSCIKIRFCFVANS